MSYRIATHIDNFVKTLSLSAARAALGVASLEDLVEVIHLDTPPVDGLPTRLAITGALTSDGMEPVSFNPLPATIEGAAQPLYEGASGSTVLDDTLWRITHFASGATWLANEPADTPELVEMWVPQGDATGVPVLEVLPADAEGATVGELGQIGIYEGNWTVSFRCIDTSPLRWEGATPGLFRDPDNAASWQLMRLGAGLTLVFDPLI